PSPEAERGDVRIQDNVIDGVRPGSPDVRRRRGRGRRRAPPTRTRHPVRHRPASTPGGGRGVEPARPATGRITGIDLTSRDLVTGFRTVGPPVASRRLPRACRPTPWPPPRRPRPPQSVRPAIPWSRRTAHR